MKIVLFCGAGISYSAGIPLFTNETFKSEERKSVECINWFNQFSEIMKPCKPTEIHYYFAQLQKTYGSNNVCIYTQNIDDLFEKCGAQVTHLHGEINNGLNDITLYGEKMPKTKYESFIEDLCSLSNEDIYITMGTSEKSISADTIIKPIKCTKIYANPKNESLIDMSQYNFILQNPLLFTQNLESIINL